MDHTPLNVFISYSHNAKDRPLLDELVKHLAPLQNAEPPLIKTWDDSHLLPGEPWDEEIKANLRNADIVLLLVSNDFNASRYIKEVEMKEAIERGKRKECHVVPVMLRPFDHMGTRYEALEMLPKIPGTQELEAITGEHWHDTDHAFTQVAVRLRELIESIKSNKTGAPAPQQAFPEEKKEADTPWRPFFQTHPPLKNLRLSDTVNCNRDDYYPDLERHFEVKGAQPGNILYLISACNTQNPTSLAKRLAYWFDEDIALFFRPDEDKVKDELIFHELPLEKKPERTFGKFWELLQNKILHQPVSFEDFVQRPADYLLLPGQARVLLAFHISESDLKEYKASLHIRYIAEQLAKLPVEQQRFILCFAFFMPQVHAVRKVECDFLLDMFDTIAENAGGVHLSCLPPVPQGDINVWWNGRFEHSRFTELLHRLQACLRPEKLPAYRQNELHDMEDVEAMQYAAYAYQRDQY